ncbi:nucleoside deaminase [bacterium]|nr:nucleoside deaminase [bacterium]
MYMKEALKLAKKAMEEGELPIASVLVLDGVVIAKGYTTEVKDKRFLVHAELNTLLEADYKSLSYKDRTRCQLYTTLEPCMMCLGACMSFFLGEVYFSLESPGDGAVEMAKKWHREQKDIPGYKLPKITGGILRQESVELFRSYVEKHNSGGMWEWAKTLAAL